MIKKFISVGGTTLEAGDFYGAGMDEVITSLEESGSNLTINTSLGSYDILLQAGDYLSFSDGSAKLVKSKFDKQDE